MNLAIDQGNTQIKAALFDGEKLKDKFDGLDSQGVQELIKDVSPARIIVSSVGDALTLTSSEKVLYLSQNTPLPFTNGYSTPATLGHDRIAAIAGAQQLFPGQNRLVVDMGTCVTYDLIDASDNYRGGAISPGMTMRFRALNTFTANLPLEVPNANAPFVGTSTSECIQSGVVCGMAAEINEIIRMYCDKYADLQIIICGGDSGFFENKLKGRIFAAPVLVLRGLNRILNYNA